MGRKNYTDSINKEQNYFDRKRGKTSKHKVYSDIYFQFTLMFGGDTKIIKEEVISMLKKYKINLPCSEILKIIEKYNMSDDSYEEFIKDMQILEKTYNRINILKELNI